MSEVTSAFPRAFAVWFKDIERWDPVSFHGIRWHWPPEVMKLIGSVLKIRKEKVDRGIFSFGSLQPITIHFDGSIDRRDVDPNREYSMDLYFARPGDIVVAKIDLKNGAVGIVPDNWKNVVVTGHFAVYEPDRSQLIPEYLQLIIQTSFFKANLWRNKVGAEGRKEVKLDFFETEKIPLPPLFIQQAIVNLWKNAQKEIVAYRERVNQVKTEIDAQFFKDLELKPLSQTESPKVFAVMWEEFLRWGVNHNQQVQIGSDITKGKYPVVDLRFILDKVQYGTSEKANKNGDGIPIIRMNNIVDGHLNLDKLKHIHLPEKDIENLLLLEGDILINRTNSKELVGKCAVFHEKDKYVFASYLIRLRLNCEKAYSDYVSYALNSKIGRQQIDAISRQIIGQANINSVEIQNLQIPLPPLKVQHDIIQNLKEGLNLITPERDAADRRALEIKEEVESLILGTKKLE